MAGMRYSPFEIIARKDREMTRHAENSARLAQSFGVKLTEGWGEFVFDTAITFDAPFLRRPTVSYGWSLLDEDNAEQLRTSRFPRATGGVIRWDRSSLGFYTGAFVVITVEDRSPFIEPTDPDPNPVYKIVHDFGFLGTAMKDLPSMLKGDVKEV
jgi:hypothetical protein